MKIYLAHALTNATEEFREKMIGLRDKLESIPGVQVLRFAWVDRSGGKSTANNVYDHDMKCVEDADLFVGILDHPSAGLGMEIKHRCQLFRPLRCFLHQTTKSTRIIVHCIQSHKALNPKADLVEPIVYQDEKEIIEHVREWKVKRGM